MNVDRLMNIVLAPYMSEKSNIGAEKNRQFVFKVASDATKPEIKKAVETLFKVGVSTVRVLNVKAKQKRFGRIMGQRKSWKKAIVSLKEGYDLDYTMAEK